MMQPPMMYNPTMNLPSKSIPPKFSLKVKKKKLFNFKKMPCGASVKVENVTKHLGKCEICGSLTKEADPIAVKA